MASVILGHVSNCDTCRYVSSAAPRSPHFSWILASPSSAHATLGWAVEAQANVHQKLHNYSLAIACVNEAIALRKGLQEKSDG